MTIEQFIKQWMDDSGRTGKIRAKLMRRDLQVLIAQERVEEREACAKIAKGAIGASRHEIAAAIRARTTE